MIYAKSYKKPFDETVVRAIDSIFDELYSNNNSTMKEYLSPQQYVLEHKTAMLKVPRQTGKTEYLKKLHSVLDHESLFVVRSEQMKNDQRYRTLKDVITMNQLVKNIIFDTNYQTRSVFLFDECEFIDIKRFLTLHNKLQYSTVVLALAT